MGWILLKEISNALIAPVVAILGFWIAYQQYSVNRNRLKMDLFDRRMKVYGVIQTFFINLQTRDITFDDLDVLIQGTMEMKWVFSKEIHVIFQERFIEDVVEYLNVQTRTSIEENGLTLQDGFRKRKQLFYKIRGFQDELENYLSDFLQLRH